ncbi:MAG: hypothetical protein CMN30_32085 [Sandaracinus sp.]|nr:hypothetical protein [Sandaracinus sp.]
MAKLLPLDTAAARIRETGREAQKGRGGAPYFFICGAGISVPSVPLAWAIEKECRDRAESLGLTLGTPPADPAGRYSFWLEQAYPDADQRRAYFRQKIVGRPLTDANLRLAHLLSSGALTRCLVTPNFDDFASRALTLFGRPHVVCDHPATTARIDLDSDDPQIIHVHGTYWFYDLINTDDEIAARAQGMRGGPGMSELLGDLLGRRVPLVVGYSGWEGDVVMQALKRRLQAPLRNQLYWFCFDRAAATALPDWLRDHPNVCLVVPADGERQPAERVFDALLAALRVEAPALTRDPLAFFAKRLRESAPERAPGAPDPYFFDDVVSRVEKAAALVGSQRSSDTKERIESVRDAVRGGRYDLAARRARGIELRGMEKARVEELLEALWPACAQPGLDPKEDARVFDTFVSILDERPTAEVKRGRLASVLIGRVGAQLRADHPRKARRALEDARTRLTEDLPGMPRARQRLQLFDARIHAHNGADERALETYDALRQAFGRSRDRRIREGVIRAGVEAAEIEVRLGHADRALRRLDPYRDPSPSPALQRVTSDVHRVAALAHEALGQHAEAAAARALIP